MHEISLVRSIASTLEHEFSLEELDRLEQIDLKIGLLSNVEPLLMQNAFEAVQQAEGKFPGVRLNIETVPAAIFCDDCQVQSIIEDYRFACSACGKPSSNLVAGTELLIDKVTFSEPAV